MTVCLYKWTCHPFTITLPVRANISWSVIYVTVVLLGFALSVNDLNPCMVLGRLINLAPTNVHFIDRLPTLLGLSPSQIYSNSVSPFSYYIRMESASKSDKPLTSFLRYRGPPILQSCEVVYVVHPYLTARLFRKGVAPQNLNQRNYDLICRAFSGHDVSSLSGAK